MKLKIPKGIGMIVLLCWSISLAHGQAQTERFIPFGQSPGLSDKHTLIGVIEKVDIQTETIMVGGPSGFQTIKFTERTKIWLDRTPLKKTNLKGSAHDFRKGQRVEIKYKDLERKDFADWIKVEIIEEIDP